jgi:hypothetical protein
MGTSSDDFKGALGLLEETAMVVMVHCSHVPGVAVAPDKASDEMVHNVLWTEVDNIYDAVI